MRRTLLTAVQRCLIYNRFYAPPKSVSRRLVHVCGFRRNIIDRVVRYTGTRCARPKQELLNPTATVHCRTVFFFLLFLVARQNEHVHRAAVVVVGDVFARPADLQRLSSPDRGCRSKRAETRVRGVCA